MSEDAATPLLELRGVSKAFGAVQALSKVNLSIPAGKVTALVGTDGLVKDVQVHGGNPVLVQEVENTLKKWKYVPASYETKIELEFKF